MTKKEIAVELGLMINSKAVWLKNFSSGAKKRPGWEIDQKRREMQILELIRRDYQR